MNSETLVCPNIIAFLYRDMCIQVIQYFYYKTRYAKATTPPEFEIEPSMALELLIAANYLEV